MNLPVTTTEYLMKDGAVIVSTTDPKGRITYVNEDFLEASGYAEAELIGKAHNIVRHPDMPEEAFADLWATLEAGKPWTGLVKNRRKNGDYYWVLANVTPVRAGGTVTGYMSVRTRPEREAVAAAGALYRRFRDKAAPGLAIREGRVVKAGRWREALTLGRWPLRRQALLGGGLASVPGLVALAALGGAVQTPLAVVALLATTVGAGVAILMRSAARAADTLQASARKVDDLTQGEFDRIFEARGEDEVARLQRALQSLRTKVGFELTDSRRRAAEATRIRQALDGASTSVLVADARHEIIYLNENARAMFLRHEGELRARLPGFSAATLHGASLGAFAGDAANEHDRLALLGAPQVEDRCYGHADFRTVTSPVLDASGKRLGTVMEWTDRTQEVKAERDLEATVTGAAAGDLERRVPLEDKTGFFRMLAGLVNSLLGTNQRVLAELHRVLGALAAGRLAERISGDYQGVYAAVMQEANATAEKLAATMQEIRATADRVNTGARELSAGNENLSQRTEEQAASLEETAASMEQLTATVNHSADNAHQARQLADNARQLADCGSETVRRAMAAMEQINGSSTKIAEIIGVVDEIAFQTNLLALNAAVEAARAGDQGKGFAVVATEVRQLASRSATAAREVKALIGESVRRVSDGSTLVNESGKTLEQILTAVDRTRTLVTEIAAAAKEQASGIAEVNMAVAQLDSVTQKNAALVSTAATETQALSEHARVLNDLVAYFDVGAQPAPAAVQAVEHAGYRRRRAG